MQRGMAAGAAMAAVHTRTLYFDSCVASATTNPTGSSSPSCAAKAPMLMYLHGMMRTHAGRPRRCHSVCVRLALHAGWTQLPQLSGSDRQARSSAYDAKSMHGAGT